MFNKNIYTRPIFFATLCWLTLTSSVQAASTNIDIQPIPDLPIRNTPPPPISAAAENSAWSVSLGAGMSYAPRYDGAANNRWRFIPLVDANYNNGQVFISPLRGIGYNFSDSKVTQYGVRLSAGHARSESVDPHLRGMGDIPYILEEGVFLNHRWGPVYFSSGITTGSHGTHVELGAGSGLPLGENDRVRFGLNLNWADKQYVQTYYGVNQEQSVASSNVLTVYDAAPGIIDYALTGNWAHNFDRNWFCNTGISYKLLNGSALDSPLTQKNFAAGANILIGYRFH